MSVPRPAMLVAIVTVPGTPAWAMIVRLLLVVAGVEHLVRNRIAAVLLGEIDQVVADLGRAAP